MTKAVIVIVVLMTAMFLAIMPTTLSAGARRGVAIAAVQNNLAPVGALLLALLARAGDAVAQNNLAVLHMRGVGTSRDPMKAAELLNEAAASGLPRAQMNLMLLRASCDMSGRDDVLRRLEEFANGGDKRAASMAADCLSWFIPFNSRVEGMRRLLAMAEIATGGYDPDEELKFGWLLLTSARDLDGYGAEGDTVKSLLASMATHYLFRAAERGRPAAYEAISKIAAEHNQLLSDETLARRVAEKTPPEWIETAAAAGHPRSRCAVGVKFAKELAERNGRASDAERQKLADLFQTCLKDRDPRRVVFRDGKEQTAGHYRLFDVWMMEEEFLIQSPKYEDYDHDIVAQEDAVRVIVKLAQDL
jgi:TPR repeat protein